MLYNSTDTVLDEFLVINAKLGNSKALGMLVKRWNKKLLLFIKQFVKKDDDAKDVAQNVWSTVIGKLSTLKDPSRFKPWLYRIAYYKSIDSVRVLGKFHSWNETQYEPAQEDHEDGMSDVLVAVRKAIEKLHEKDKTILSLYYLEGLSVKDLSKTFNIPVGTVKSRLFHAREYLKKQIKHLEYENF